VLKPRLRYIHQDVIKHKWDVLPEPVQGRVTALFRSIERPVIVGHQDDRRRVEAQLALGTITRTWV
jgi:kinetochore protein Fta7